MSTHSSPSGPVPRGRRRNHVRRTQGRFRLRTADKVWLMPSLSAVGAAAAAILAFFLGRRFDGHLPVNVDQDSLSGLFGIFASGMLSVATFTVSAIVTAANFVATGTTPRATRFSIEDAKARFVLSSFIAAFIYSIIDILLQWSRMDAEIHTLKPRHPRVRLPAITADDLIDDCFTPIARDGATAIEVVVRLQKTLASLKRSGHDGLRRGAERLSLRVAERAGHVLGTAQEKALASAAREATAAAGRSPEDMGIPPA